MINNAQKILIENKVLITDCCYDRSVECADYQDNMLSGYYNCFVTEKDYGDLGLRIESIEIVHEKYKRPKRWEFKSGNIGVDSGQAGIFCDSIYPYGNVGKYGDLDTFYGKCCQLTSQNDKELEIYGELTRAIETQKKSDTSDTLLWFYNYFKREVEQIDNNTEEEYIKLKLNEIPESNSTKIELEQYFRESYNNRESYKYSYNRYIAFKNYIEQGILPNKPKLINWGIIEGKGIVSRSGFGDGIYSCYANFNSKKQCVAVKIKF